MAPAHGGIVELKVHLLIPANEGRASVKGEDPTRALWIDAEDTHEASHARSRCADHIRRIPFRKKDPLSCNAHTKGTYGDYIEELTPRIGGAGVSERSTRDRPPALLLDGAPD